MWDWETHPVAFGRQPVLPRGIRLFIIDFERVIGVLLLNMCAERRSTSLRLPGSFEMCEFAPSYLLPRRDEDFGSPSSDSLPMARFQPVSDRELGRGHLPSAGGLCEQLVAWCRLLQPARRKALDLGHGTGGGDQQDIRRVRKEEKNAGSCEIELNAPVKARTGARRLRS